MTHSVLRIFLKTAHVFDLVLTSQNAREQLLKWESIEFHVKDIRFLTGTTIDGVQYACSLEDITSLLVLPYVPQQQGGAQQLTNVGSRWMGSGLNN